MLMPSRTKFRKQQRGKMRGNAKRGHQLHFGEFGISAMERGYISNRQIEAARIAISRHVKRGGRVFLRIFPDYPFTKKPAETRMGKGKGNPEIWVCKVKPGRMLFELSGVSKELAQSAMRLAQHKLPIKTKFFSRDELVM